jgi:ABC-type glutathione transport system ATPase component
VGESGCGKSTLARAAVGMVAPLAGTIRFEGVDVKPLTRRARPHELARLQMVFQNPFSSLNPRRRVGDQIGDAVAVLGLAPRAEWGARVALLLEQVGLPTGAARGYPHEFSGGQRQRIAIARALAANPSVIVLD